MKNTYILGKASELTLGYINWIMPEHPYRGTRPANDDENLPKRPQW